MTLVWCYLQLSYTTSHHILYAIVFYIYVNAKRKKQWGIHIYIYICEYIYWYMKIHMKIIFICICLHREIKWRHMCTIMSWTITKGIAGQSPEVHTSTSNNLILEFPLKQNENAVVPWEPLTKVVGQTPATFMWLKSKLESCCFSHATVCNFYLKRQKYLNHTPVTA